MRFSRFTALLTFVVLAAACGDSAKPTEVSKSTPDLDIGSFLSPLSDSAPVSNVFDHNLPFEFADTNGYQLSFWGEKLSGIDGHNGYDYVVPEGIAVRAAGGGTVVFAGSEAPFFCPLLNATVSGNAVTILHRLAGGDSIATVYDHLSRIDVKVGAHVAISQQIGLSGNTGCSTGPHLHFGAYRIAKNGAQIVVDPYGWQATSADPWAADSRGAASVALWSAANQPPIYKELRRTGAYPKPAFIAISAVRYAGIDDDHHPNNEFVDFQVNPDLASWDFGADTLKNIQGPVFVFPSGFKVPGGGLVRIYTGTGTNTTSTLYANRPAPAWDNLGDCLRIVDTLKRVLTGTTWGNVSDATCASLKAIAPLRASAPTGMERSR